MRKITFLIILLPCMAFGQLSYEERIGQAINASDWFALDSIYNEAPKDSVSPFLEVFARCMLSNRFNRTDISIPAFAELLNTQSESLDMGSLVSSAIMYGMDLGRVGSYSEAAQVLTAVKKAVRPYVEAHWLSMLEQFAALYTALSAYHPYQISFPTHDATGVIPFKLGEIGPEDKQQYLIHLVGSTINGKDADIMFDTGAGINIISEELAAQYDLVPLDVPFDVKGYGTKTGRFALVREMKIGNITVTDVPFLIVPLSTGNAKADKYFKDFFNLVVGCELMLQLKDLTFDFQRSEILVPSVAPLRSDEKPNMCFSSGMGLLAKATVKGTPLTTLIDTGNPNYISLANTFLEKNEAYVRTQGKKGSSRLAGLGGVKVDKYYRLSDMPLTLGGNSAVVPVVDVARTSGRKSASATDANNNLGLSSLMLFGKVRFNLVDFVLTTEPK